MRPAPLLLAAGCLAAAMTAPAAADPPGAWVSPLGEPPRVVRAFRLPAERWAAGHRGVDVSGSPHTWVRAAGAGRVSIAGPLAGRGVVVVVHGALRTTYEPVTPSVRVGDRVRAGTLIGRLVPGHVAAQPAAGVLHWGLLRGDTYLDPMSLLRGRPVRLLPRWRDPPAAAMPAPPGAAEARTVDPAPAASRPGGSGRSVVAAATVTALAAVGAMAAFARASPAG